VTHAPMMSKFVMISPSAQTGNRATVEFHSHDTRIKISCEGRFKTRKNFPRTYSAAAELATLGAGWVKEGPIQGAPARRLPSQADDALR
jgi:hypothetical protein